MLARIGQGGMGAVYLAEHAVLGRKAAIKVLLPEFSRNPGLVARFLNEARATAQLRHPAFVEIFDSGSLPDGSAYLIMEFLDGEDLGQRIRRCGPLPVTEAAARELISLPLHSAAMSDATIDRICDRIVTFLR